MSAGTKYTTKTALLDAILKQVYANKKNKVSASNAQTAMYDIVESLWGGGQLSEQIAYADLITAIGTNELVPGTIYEFEYQCIHQIPYTSVLNINSPNYTNSVETFYVKALGNSTLSPVVVSKEYPEDLILMDFNANTAEDGTTARTGKVVYRKDQTTNNETGYDFRAVYFRRYPIKYNDSSINNSFGLNSNASKEDLVMYNGSLYKAATDIVDFDGLAGQLFKVDYENVNAKWLPFDGLFIANITLPADTSQFEDLLTFQSTINGSCKNITIGETDSNDGYNNIVLTSCSNLTLAKDSVNSHLILNRDNTKPLLIENSLYTENDEQGSLVITGSIVHGCDTSVFWDLSQSTLYWCQKSEIGAEANVLSLQAFQSSTLGVDSNDVYGNYVFRSSIGNGCRDSMLTNITNSNIGSNFNTNKAMSMDSCDISTGVNNIIFEATANSYNTYQYVTIKNNCSNITAETGSTVSNVIMENGVSNISVQAGASMIATTLGSNCSDFELKSGATIEDVTFSNSFKGLVMEAGASINNCRLNASIRSYATLSLFINLILDNGSSLRASNLTLETRYESFDDTLGNTSFYYSAGSIETTTGNLNNLKIIDISSSIDNSSFTNSSSVYLDRSSILNSAFNKSNVAAVSSSSFRPCSIIQVDAGSDTTINISEGTVFERSTVSVNCNITIDGTIGIAGVPADVNGCIFNDTVNVDLRSSFTNQTFNKTGNGVQDIYDADDANALGVGYECYSLPFIATSPTTPNLLTNEPNSTYLLRFSNDIAITLDKAKLAPNRKYKAILTNSTIGAASNLIVTFFDSGSTIDLSASGATEYVEFIRVKSNADLSVDKVVILNQSTL